jgi:hypothetical protein
LFGPYVDELNAFIGSGDYNNAIVVLQFAKAKPFQGCMSINVFFLSPLFINPFSDFFLYFLCRQDTHTKLFEL